MSFTICILGYFYVNLNCIFRFVPEYRGSLFYDIQLIISALIVIIIQFYLFDRKPHKKWMVWLLFYLEIILSLIFLVLIISPWLGVWKNPLIIIVIQVLMILSRIIAALKTKTVGSSLS